MEPKDRTLPLRDRIAELRTAAADTRRRLAGGEIIDLSGLDDEAGKLCDAVAALAERPRGEAAGALAAALEGLLVELELLTDAVESGRTALAERLAGATGETSGG